MIDTIACLNQALGNKKVSIKRQLKCCVVWKKTGQNNRNTKNNANKNPNDCGRNSGNRFEKWTQPSWQAPKSFAIILP